MELFNALVVKMGLRVPQSDWGYSGKGPFTACSLVRRQPDAEGPARIGDEGKAVGSSLAGGFAVFESSSFRACRS
jgi:hypothetical protein